MGGENDGGVWNAVKGGGSSPRGRGKRHNVRDRFTGFRLIPAWAGKTTIEALKKKHNRAHPRVGGENMTQAAPGDLVCGSSPRGRGKLKECADQAAALRLIPAWAGKTVDVAVSFSGSPAHPRVGGENAELGFQKVGGSGSSPRGRGKRSFDGPGVDEMRLIPAWAGKTKIALAKHPHF